MRITAQKTVMANLSLRNVTKYYDKALKPAVSDFNLEIADKEFIVFVGPSGCGKSTTLRMVAGLEEITGGEIYIGDTLVNNVEPKNRDIAMVFQDYALYPHMTIYNNIAFGLKLKWIPNGKTMKLFGKEIALKRRYTKDEIKEKVLEAARILEIEEYLERKPKALSGGQRQRVAIGRAIVRNPKVFLMDEPLSNLDAKLRNQMRAEIILLRKRLNTTFIYVTHDQTEAMTLGDRIVIMKDGVAQQIGTPSEVFNKPANLFVAGFIGAPQMNFFDAKLLLENDSYSVEYNGERFSLTENAINILSEKNAASQDITLGVRPEHITLVMDENEKQSGVSYIETDLSVCEMMGSELHLHIMIEGNKYIVRIPTLGISDDELDRYSQEQKLWITFPPETLHLFSKETQKNLIYTNTNEG